MTDKRILLGRIVAPHGLKGEVKIKSFTADPLDVASYGMVSTSDGRKLKLVHPRVQGDAVVAGIKGIADRTSAESLRGLDLSVDREKLPEPDEDEFYHADLLGMAVIDEAGHEHGTVAAMHTFGGGDVLEVKRAKGSVFLPFTKANAPLVDLDHHRIVLSDEGVAALNEAGAAPAAGAA